MSQQTIDFGDDEFIINPFEEITTKTEKSHSLTVNILNEAVYEIEHIQRQFLVHSFLYYKLDDTVISDANYDKICDKVLACKNNQIWSYTKYAQLCNGLDEAKSGYYIKEYPPGIITAAMHLLYNHKQKNGTINENFELFAMRYGMKVIIP